jgi:branched-subunit amino acid aminotransferase/4-amino-4-deoxychorismate lyase
MSNPDTFVSLNGELMRTRDARVPAVQTGLYYGAGCFETCLMETGQVFRFDEHLERLNGGLNYLGVPPHFQVEKKELFDNLLQLIKKNRFEIDKVRIRIQCSLNEQKGYYRDDTMNLNRIITCTPAKKMREPVRLIISKTRMIPGECRPAQFKLSNMLHYRNAFREAADAGADDALMLTINDAVAESSIANIFWKKENTIYTPSPECDILPGIMRNCIMKIIRERTSANLVEGEFQPDELKQAEAVWLTNSVLEIHPVQSINEKKYRTDDPIISVLRNGLQDLKSGEGIQ